jgi:hypothetical protein
VRLQPHAPHSHLGCHLHPHPVPRGSPNSLIQAAQVELASDYADGARQRQWLRHNDGRAHRQIVATYWQGPVCISMPGWPPVTSSSSTVQRADSFEHDAQSWAVAPSYYLATMQHTCISTCVPPSSTAAPDPATSAMDAMTGFFWCSAWISRHLQQASRGAPELTDPTQPVLARAPLVSAGWLHQREERVVDTPPPPPVRSAPGWLMMGQLP